MDCEHKETLGITASGHGGTTVGDYEYSSAEWCRGCGALRLNDFGPWGPWVTPGTDQAKLIERGES